MKKRFLLFVVLAYIAAAHSATAQKVHSIPGSEESESYIELLKGRWESGENVLTIYDDGRIAFYWYDETGTNVSVAGDFTADKKTLYIKTDGMSYYYFDHETPAPELLVLPYTVSHKNGAERLEVKLDGKPFVLERRATYNLLAPGWRERDECLTSIAGSWRNGDNFLRIQNNKISFTFFAGESWGSASGLVTVDEQNLYVTTFDYILLDQTFDSFKADKIVIPYMVTGEYENETLTVTIDGKTFSLARAGEWFYPSRRQTRLNGVWKAEKELKFATDWNITLYFEDESFMAVIKNEEFEFGIFGDVFYENGMMCIREESTKEAWSAEQSGFDDDGGDDLAQRYAKDVYGYAKYYELPEYVFLGAAFDSPYQAILGYRVGNGTLTLTAYGKELVLKKQ